MKDEEIKEMSKSLVNGDDWEESLMTDEEKGFHYWLGGPGIAEALNSKDRIKFLNRLKDMYLRTLMELNSIEIKLEKEQEEIRVKNEEIEALKNLNSQLTEENMKLEEYIKNIE